MSGGSRPSVVSRTLDQMLEQAARTVPEVGPREVRRMIRELPDLVRLDVRETDEFDLVHLADSINIPRGNLEFCIEEAVPERTCPILVISRAGLRGLLAARTLQELGYRSVWYLAGGILKWAEYGYPLQGLNPEKALEALQRDEGGVGLL